MFIPLEKASNKIDSRDKIVGDNSLMLPKDRFSIGIRKDFLTGWLKIVSFYLILFFSLYLAGCATVLKKKGVEPSSGLWQKERDNLPPSQISDRNKNWDSETLAHYTTGLLLERQGKVKEASAEYRSALAGEPDSFAIHQSLGGAYFKLNELAQAEKEFQALLKLNPQDPAPHKYLSFLSLAQGDFNQAEVHYREMIKLNPEGPEPYFALSALYLNLKKYSEAVQVLNKLIKLQPGNSWAYIELAKVLSFAEKDKQALRTMRRARSLFPDNKEVSLNLGIVYESQEKWLPAAEIYKELLESDPNNINLNLHLSHVYTQLKEYDKAIQYYRIILELVPQDIKTLKVVGLLFYHLGDKEKALRTFQEILQIDPQNVPAKIVTGTIYEEMAMIPQAVKIYEEIISLHPEDLKIYINLAYLYLKENEFQKVIDLFKEKQFHERRIYFLQGFASYKLNQFEDAAGFLKEAVKLSPDDDISHFYLAIIYEQIGDLPLAIYEFQETIRLNPQFAEAYNYLAYTYAEKGIHLDEAVELADKAVSMEPQNGAYLDTLAWVHCKKGMLNLALKELKKAVLLQEDPVIFEHLGDVYYKKKQWRKAEEAWEKSLNLSPGNADILKKLKRLREIFLNNEGNNS